MGLIEAILERVFPPQAEPVCEARPGRLVTLRGLVVPRDVVDSPLSGVPCVYYRYLVESWSRHTAMWLAVEHDEAICEFYLQDASGRAVIAPEHARVELARGRHPEVVPMPGGQRAVEARLRPGDEVEVHGVLEEITDLLDESRGFRDRAVRFLLRAPEGGTIRIRLV